MALYYPVYLHIAERLCVVVGGGPVAERKVMGLLDAGAMVRVVSPTATDHLVELARDGRIERLAQEYSPEHLDGCVLAFAATNSRAVNVRVSADATAKGLRVNVADNPGEGDFITPAVVRRGEFCLSLTTGGNSPALAARLADEMEARFGQDYGDFVELLGTARDRIKEWTSDLTARRKAMAAVIEHEAQLLGLLSAGRGEDSLDLALSVARGVVGAECSPGGDD